MKIYEGPKEKLLVSKDVNYKFNKQTGYMSVWGKTLKDDPDFSPYGPFIADIELSAGNCSGNCRYCYKGNSSRQENRYMSLETFQKLHSKLPRVLTQVALGITDLDNNPDLWKIMDYCRTNDYNEIIPNITINCKKITSEQYDNLAKYCGAVACSWYDDDECFTAVQELSNRGMKQVNIHAVLAVENYEDCLSLIDKAATDPRLKGLNAIVFLTLKPKGRGGVLTSLRNVEAYRYLINKSLENKIGFGFDSCGCDSFLEATKDHPDYEKFKVLGEKCESGLFSSYFNVDGKYCYCSFAEGKEEAIEVLDDNVDFLKDVWLGAANKAWKNRLLKNDRNCPLYNIGPKR